MDCPPRQLIQVQRGTRNAELVEAHTHRESDSARVGWGVGEGVYCSSTAVACTRRRMEDLAALLPPDLRLDLPVYDRQALVPTAAAAAAAASPALLHYRDPRINITCE